MTAHSAFFAVICNGQWGESKDRVVELHDDRPSIFARLLQFVYCKDYQSNEVGTRSANVEEHLTLRKLLGHVKATTETRARKITWTITSDEIVHYEVYEVADKYGCTGLQDLARSNIAIECERKGLCLIDLSWMIQERDLGCWRDFFNEHEELKEIFAHKIAIEYKNLVAARHLAKQDETKAGMSEGALEWLRWLEEDHSFCLMVVDAMSKKF